MDARQAAAARSAEPPDMPSDDDWDIDAPVPECDPSWDPFDPDDEEPEPEYGDFWFEPDGDDDE